MLRSAYCLKIQEDTRNPERPRPGCLDVVGRRVSSRGDWEREMGDRRSILKDLSPFRAREVCAWKQIFLKKWALDSRFRSLCPLILVTGEGTMVNNMVLSREIEWIGYEHKRSMLQVEFIAGPIYQYENVPEVVYQEFLTAPSYGRFFESNIKNKYQTRKVR